MHILFEDNHLLAVIKPFGMPSQGDETGDLSILDAAKAYLKEKYNKPGDVYLALLHRLDRPVGGVMLFAKTSKAAARLSEQFREREVNKEYLAITEQVPEAPEGKLTHYLRKLPDKNIMRAYIKPVHQTQEARLTYRLLHTQGQRALVAVSLDTGRRHQIRVQLAAIGCTIVGDVKYGKSDFLPDKSIALFAWKLTVTHPITKEPLTWMAPWPLTTPWSSFPNPNL